MALFGVPLIVSLKSVDFSLSYSDITFTLAIHLQCDFRAKMLKYILGFKNDGIVGQTGVRCIDASL